MQKLPQDRVDLGVRCHTNDPTAIVPGCRNRTTTMSAMTVAVTLISLDHRDTICRESSHPAARDVFHRLLCCTHDIAFDIRLDLIDGWIGLEYLDFFLSSSW
jgi:hypothetical protein